MNEIEQRLKNAVKKLEEAVQVSKQPGNADQGPYMRGMANGLICALAIMEGEEPKYLDAKSVESSEYIDHVLSIAAEDAQGLIEAQKQYGNSWMKRGGQGAYIIGIRKADRLEKAMPKFGFDIFKAILEDTRGEGVLDDVRDLRRYLMLWEAEARALSSSALPTHRDNVEEQRTCNNCGEHAGDQGDCPRNYKPCTENNYCNWIPQ